MAEQDVTRQLRLAHEQAIYRYLTALKSGDSESMAAIWHDAEQDTVLATMLWETLDAYQQAEPTIVHPEEIPQLQDLLNTLFSQDAVPANVSPNTSQHTPDVPLPTKRQGYIPERIAPNMNTATSASLTFPQTVEGTPRQRLSAFLQSSAAVLVVGTLILGFLFLFTAHHMEPGGIAPPVSHVNGTWRIVPSPSPGTSENTLNGVAALTQQDAWAVGYKSGNNNLMQQTLIEHWNGTQWSVVKSPNPGNVNVLYGVAAVSTNDVWAVGSATDTVDGSQRAALIEHWNGTQWSTVNSPHPAKGFAALYAISALSANDIWAVGIAITNNSPQAGQTLTEHWNGTRWSIVESPSVLTDDYLNGVVAISANDVWAVGISSPSTNPQGALSLTEHWNGTQWSIVKSPNPGSNVTLYGVVAASPNDVWTVGYFENAQNNYQTLILHWNGNTWNIVKSPNSGSKLNVLNAATLLSANNIWAVGYASNSDANHAQTFIQHWDGTQWTVVKSPNVPGAGNNWLLGIATVPSTNSIWTVGFSAQSGFVQEQTLIERYS